MPRSVKLLCSALVVLASLLLSFGVHVESAVAHSQLISSDPTEGQTVTEVRSITLHFSAGILPQYSEWILRDGAQHRLKLSEAKLDVTRSIVTLKVVNVPAAGPCLFGFNIVSVDGHTVSGFIHFNYKTGHHSVANTATSIARKDSADAATKSATTLAVAAVTSGLALVVIVAVALTVMFRRRVKPRGQ